METPVNYLTGLYLPGLFAWHCTNGINRIKFFFLNLVVFFGTVIIHFKMYINFICSVMGRKYIFGSKGRAKTLKNKKILAYGPGKKGWAKKGRAKKGRAKKKAGQIKEIVV